MDIQGSSVVRQKAEIALACLQGPLTTQSSHCSNIPLLA
jgi:hypothetical protein